MDSVAQVKGVVSQLRRWGFDVTEVPGWSNRGSGALTTTGRLEHHTAGARSGDTPSLRIVTFGRAGLRNSLCRWYVSRSGRIYLVARRRSWHAGRGVKGSNSSLSGTEAENTGTGEPWTQASLDAQAAISAAESRIFGFPATRVWDHREHAPRRKVDRTGIDSQEWRARVGARAHGTHEEDDLAYLSEEAQRFLEKEYRYRKKRDGDGLRPTTTQNGVEQVIRPLLQTKSTNQGKVPVVDLIVGSFMRLPKTGPTFLRQLLDDFKARR